MSSSPHPPASSSWKIKQGNPNNRRSYNQQTSFFFFPIYLSCFPVACEVTSLGFMLREDEKQKSSGIAPVCSGVSICPAAENYLFMDFLSGHTRLQISSPSSSIVSGAQFKHSTINCSSEPPNTFYIEKNTLKQPTSSHCVANFKSIQSIELLEGLFLCQSLTTALTFLSRDAHTLSSLRIRRDRDTTRGELLQFESKVRLLLWVITHILTHRHDTDIFRSWLILPEDIIISDVHHE